MTSRKSSKKRRSSRKTSRHSPKRSTTINKLTHASTITEVRHILEKVPIQTPSADVKNSIKRASASKSKQAKIDDILESNKHMDTKLSQIAQVAGHKMTALKANLITLFRKHLSSENILSLMVTSGIGLIWLLQKYNNNNNIPRKRAMIVEFQAKPYMVYDPGKKAYTDINAEGVPGSERYGYREGTTIPA